MTSMIPDTSKLSPNEKVALMERLWEDLSSLPDLNPPAWHEDVLNARAKEWDLREKASQDWTEAKEELSRDLK